MAITTLKKTLILEEQNIMALFTLEVKKYFHLCKGEELEKLHARLKAWPLLIIPIKQLQVLDFEKNYLEDVNMT